MKTYEVIIKGRVQGVGFRMFVYKLAKKLKINGFVMNSISKFNIVEIEAQGNFLNIETFLKNLNIGPGLSRVDQISKRELNKDPYKSFIIK